MNFMESSVQFKAVGRFHCLAMFAHVLVVTGNQTQCKLWNINAAVRDRRPEWRAHNKSVDTKPRP